MRIQKVLPLIVSDLVLFCNCKKKVIYFRLLKKFKLLESITFSSLFKYPGKVLQTFFMNAVFFPLVLKRTPNDEDAVKCKIVCLIQQSCFQEALDSILAAEKRKWVQDLFFLFSKGLTTLLKALQSDVKEKLYPFFSWHKYFIRIFREVGWLPFWLFEIMFNWRFKD